MTSRAFYALGPGQRSTSKTRRVPRWFGALWFGTFGCVLIYWSVPALRGGWDRRDLYVGVWIIAFLGAAWLFNKALRRLASGPIRKNET
jgi:apolipoprotein N-acyltransferase